MKILSLNFLPALLFVLVFAGTAGAQSISGVVLDASRAPITNADVSLVSDNQIVSRAKTDEKGAFSLSANGANNLRLRVVASGFAVFEKPLENQTSFEVILSPSVSCRLVE